MPLASAERANTSRCHATFNYAIGLHSRMVDLDNHQGYGNFVGSWDMIRTYSTTFINQSL